MTFPPLDVRLPCIDMGELFHPRTYGDTAREQVAQAKAVCARCQWRDDCLTDALARGETVGILGGLTPYQRQQLGTVRSKPAHMQPQPIRHGTPGGAQAHRKRGEKACPECLTAESAAKKRRRAA